MNGPFETGSLTVDRMSRLQISGNVIPVSWYKTIRKPTGKPNLNAIIILADIVYWYRAVEIRDEMTGQLIGLRKKFHSDMLQRSYQQLADQFGITKRDATNAVVELEKLGVVRRVFRTVEVKGQTVSNVLFLDLNVTVLEHLTYPKEAETGTPEARSRCPPDTVSPKSGRGVTEISERVSPEFVGGGTKTSETYTESTAKDYRTKDFYQSYQYVEDMVKGENMQDSKISVSSLNLFYGENHALKDINIKIRENTVMALIGPSGCGKSTFLKCLNRMNDLVDGVKVDGKVLLDGEDIYDPGVDTTLLRKKVGMVFQQPNPFPMSIYDNIAYGPRIHGIKNKSRLDEIVENALKGAAIFDEVKDRLKAPALGLSGGQQQRLCIARALAVEPEVLLMDEPTSALDPISTLKIEELMNDLKKRYTVVVVTHNMQQAARVSDETAFFLLGELVEADETMNIFGHPKDKRTEDYITGRFG